MSGRETEDLLQDIRVLRAECEMLLKVFGAISPAADGAEGCDYELAELLGARESDGRRAVML
jgi:hypothetical protein